jgi:hypothetical protein
VSAVCAAGADSPRHFARRRARVGGVGAAQGSGLFQKVQSATPLQTRHAFAEDWQGRTYTVTVVDPGFLFAGRTYRSLSVIARVITGTSWSGPAIFGLLKRRTRAGRAA